MYAFDGSGFSEQVIIPVSKISHIGRGGLGCNLCEVQPGFDQSHSIAGEPRAAPGSVFDEFSCQKAVFLMAL